MQLKPLEMRQYIWFGTLFLNMFFSSVITAQDWSKPHISKDTQKLCRISKDKHVKTYLYNEEIRVSDYSFFLYMVGKEHGEKSDKYKALIPDTSFFFSNYRFKFTYMEKSPDYMVQLQSSLPMIGLSYEQALAYCRWKEKMHKPSRKYVFVYSLPTKNDYETAMGRAKITQRKALSALQQTKRSHAIYGLTDNVAEYLADRNLVVAGGRRSTLQFEEITAVTEPIGFRLKVERRRK